MDHLFIDGVIIPLAGKKLHGQFARNKISSELVTEYAVAETQDGTRIYGRVVDDLDIVDRAAAQVKFRRVVGNGVFVQDAASGAPEADVYILVIVYTGKADDAAVHSDYGSVVLYFDKVGGGTGNKKGLCFLDVGITGTVLERSGLEGNRHFTGCKDKCLRQAVTECGVSDIFR